MTEAADISRLERRSAQRAALMAQLFANVIIMAVTGQYMILYANDVVGLSPQQIAAIFSIAPFLSILRLPAIPYIERFGLVKTFRFARILQSVVILILILVPAVVLNLPLLALLLGVFIFFREIGLGTVWQPMLNNITTPEDRGTFFARMRTSFTLVTLAVTGLATVLIGAEMQEHQYKFLLGLAAFGVLNSWFWAGRIPEPKVHHSSAGRKSAGHAILGIWEICRKSPLFRIPLIVTLIISMAQLPIDLVYFREGLQVPANLIALKISFIMFGQLLSLILWGKTSDTLGFRLTLIGLLWLTTALSMVLWFVPVFPPMEGNLLETIQTYPLGTVAVLSYGFGTGIMNAGLGIVTTAVLHYHVDNRNRMVTMNVFSLCQLLFQAIMILAVGFLLQHLVVPQRSLPQPEAILHFDYYKVFRGGLVPLLMLLAIPLVLRLPNLKPWFSVADFFSVFRHNPIRSLLGNRHLYDEDEVHRLHLTRSLTESPNPLNLNLLSELSRDPSFEVKMEAVRGLARYQSPYAEKLALDILGDTERRGLWEYAAWALGEMRSRQAVEALIPLLHPDLSSRIRAAAARSLGKIGDPRAIQPLLDSARNEENRLHVVAANAWALLFLGAEERVDFAFSSLLRLRDREERYELLSILSRLLGITDKWLLVSSADLSTAQSLEDYLSEFKLSWLEANQQAIDAFRQRDFLQVNQLLREAVGQTARDGQHPVVRSLLAVLENEASDWSPLSVLAVAWILFHADEK